MLLIGAMSCCSPVIDKPISTVAMAPGSKITAALWGPLDQYIITGHEDGSLRHYSTVRD